MKKQADRPSLLPRFTRFAGVGGLCYCIGLLILWLCTSIVGIDYRISMVIAFMVTCPIGFVLNERHTFRYGSVKGRFEFLRYVLAVLGSLVASLCAVWLLVSLGFNYLLANIAVTAVFLLINFTTHFLWTFGSRFRQ